MSESARTRTMQCTGVDAAKAASILRQTDAIPLAKLRKQIIAEDYREWRHWEEKQDFAAVMQARYKTEVIGKQVWFPFTQEGEIQHNTSCSLKDYWTVRLHQDNKRKDTQTMDVLKVQISKDARISKDVLETRLKEADIDAGALLRKHRAPSDNLRLALTSKLRPWRKFAVGELRCEVIAKNTTKEELDIRVQVCCIDSDKVSHTDDLCVIRSTTAKEQKAGMPTMVTDYQNHAAHVHQFRDVVRDLDALALEQFGSKYYFEGDIRRLVDALLDAACLPLWPGLRLVLTPEASDRVRALAGLLSGLDAGYVHANLLSLDNTPANREALGRELSEQFVEQLEKLEERCGIPAPHGAAIRKDFAALQEKIDLVETTLGIELDYLDAAMSVERALEAIES